MSRALAVVFVLAVLMLAGVQSHGGEEASPGPYPGRNWAKQGECGPYHNWDACRPGYCCSQRGYCGNTKDHCHWCNDMVQNCPFLPPKDNWTGAPMPIPKELIERDNTTMPEHPTGNASYPTNHNETGHGNSPHGGNSSNPSGHGRSGPAGSTILPGTPKDLSNGAKSSDVVVTDTKSGVASFSMLFPIVCVMIISAITQ